MSLRRRYPRPRIDLGSIAGLFEHDHELRAHCPICDRWAVLPLAELVAQGKGSLRLPIRVRCGECGERGTLRVQPPVPTRLPGGWMESATRQASLARLAAGVTAHLCRYHTETAAPHYGNFDSVSPHELPRRAVPQ